MADERDDLKKDLEVEETVDYTEFYGEEKNNAPKKFWWIIPIIIIAVVVCIVAAIIVERMTPSKKYADLYEFYGVTTDSISVIWNETIVSDAIKIEDTYYLELEMVSENFDNRFYYDASLDKLLYTTLDEVYEIPFAQTVYHKGEEQQVSDYYIAVRENDVIYVALDFLQDKMECSYYVLTAPERVVMVSDGVEIYPLIFKEDATIRTKESIKGDILAKPQVDELWYKVEEKTKTGWIKVAIVDGRKGFVKEDEVLSSAGEAYCYDSGYEVPEYKGNQRDYELIMAWHPIYNVEDNGNIEALLANTKGVNTISPTWYKVKDETGELLSMADKDYVDYVHSLGIEVWPLVSDFTNVEGDGWSVKELLSNADNRRNLIENLINEVITLDCEGINIDFEYIRDDNGEDYAQFIRELSIRCREEGLVVSTDNPPPKAYNQQYNFEILGDCVDYVIIMGYDEYTKANNEPGPVASYEYVKSGIVDALTMIPADKLVNGIPFYTRLWTEYIDENGEYVLDTKTCTMENVWSTVEKLGTTPEWNAELRLYEIFADIDGIHYSMWLEEETAMAERIKLVREHNLAGVSAWALGMETDSIWDVIIETK